MMRSVRGILSDESGASAVLFAVSLPPLIGISALAVDLGSLYLTERRLQNVADAAAAASMSGDPDMSARAAVEQVIADSGLDGISIFELTEGEYRRDPEIHYSARFDPTSLYPNAARVTLTQEVPLFFGQLLTGQEGTSVAASSMASRMDMAGFMLGTRVAAVDGVLASSVLSALGGADLGLTPENINRLENTQIDILDFAQSLGPLNELDGETFGEILDADTPLYLAIEAMADAAPDPATESLLDDMAMLLGGDFLTLSDLIDLGPLRDTDVNDGVSGVSVDAYSLLRALLQAAQGDSYEAVLDTGLPGLAEVHLRLAGGFSEERSPWLTVDTASEVTLRTAETRLLVKAKTGSLAGLPSVINLPIYAELASAEAQMTDIVCGAGDGSNGVYVEARPSIGTIAIADVDTEFFDDFTSPLWLEPALLVNAVAVQVEGYSEIGIGGGNSSTLHFTPTDVEDRRTKSASTTDPLQGIASSLVEGVEMDVSVLGLGLGLGDTTSIVGSNLAVIAPTLDSLLISLTDVLGVKLGTADVTVDRLRCGVPTLVG